MEKSRISQVVDWIVAADLSEGDLDRLVKSSFIPSQKIAVSRYLFALAILLPILNAAACLIFEMLSHYERHGDVLFVMALGPLFASPVCAGIGAMVVAAMSDNPNSRY